MSGFLGFGGGFFSRVFSETEDDYLYKTVVKKEHGGIAFYLELGFQINTRSGIFFNISTDGWIGVGDAKTTRTISSWSYDEDVDEKLIEFYKWDVLSISVGYRF